MGPYALVLTSQMGILGCSLFNFTAACDVEPEGARKIRLKQDTLVVDSESQFTQLTGLSNEVALPYVSANVSKATDEGVTTTELGSGVVQGVTAAQQFWGRKHNLTVTASASCNLLPGMVYDRKKFKIREWFHIDTVGACCQKCRTTENCAYFISNPSSAGHCYLLRIQAYTKKPVAKKGWTGGSIVDLKSASAGSAEATPAEENVCRCPEKCVHHMK